MKIKIMDIDLLGFMLKSKICAVRESFLCDDSGMSLYDMRSGKFNSTLMAQLLSVLTNITQVRLEKVMARATKTTMEGQKRSTLFLLILF